MYAGRSGLIIPGGFSTALLSLVVSCVDALGVQQGSFSTS